MKKTLIFVVLLLSLFAYKVSAAPNTGPLPENGVKVNFNENGTAQSVEGSGWILNQQSGSMTLTKGDIVVTLNQYTFKNGTEIIGFSWMIEGAVAVLWVKHGTTSAEYGDGTSGEFTTSDNKGVSNAVFLIELIDDEEDDDEELDDEEDENDDDEELDDEEDENDDDEELDDEEDENDDDEELDDEEDENDDDEELDDEEDENDDDEDENDDDEELDDEEDENDDDEELDDEEDEDDDEVLGDDDENVDEEDEEEDEVLGEDDEQLPDTSDATSGLGLLGGLLGFVMLLASKKKD